MCLPLHWRTGAYGCTHWCIRAFVHVCMYAFVHLWIDVIARWRASAKAAPPETDPRAPGLPRNQLVSQCRPSSVSLKNASLGCGTPASSRTDSQHGFPPTCPIPPTGRMGAHASVAWMVNTSVVRSGTTGFWVTRAPSMGSGGAVFAVRRANEKCANAPFGCGLVRAPSRGSPVAGTPVAGPHNLWESRAALNRQARPEEAQEPSWGTAKGCTQTMPSRPHPTKPVRRVSKQVVTYVVVDIEGRRGRRRRVRRPRVRRRVRWRRRRRPRGRRQRWRRWRWRWRRRPRGRRWW